MPLRSERVYLCFLGLLAMVPPISTDMYLPAIPSIAARWGVSDATVSLSLVLWFAAFSVGLLVCGPLSDKYGRRPVLLWGLGCFVAASFLCGLADNVTQLIAFRVLQGLSAAAPSSMCMAICRDRYAGVDRQHALAYVSIILAVAPMLAPSLGAAFLRIGSWRAIFFMQGALAFGTFLATFAYEETVRTFFPGTIPQALARYAALWKNKGYVAATVIMGLFAAPFYGYLAFSQKAYITLFGLSATVFSVFFAVNAFISMTGAWASTRLAKTAFSPRILAVCLGGGFVACVLVLAFGHLHPYSFAACIALYSFFCGMSRPMSSHLILEQVSADIGSASAGIIFYQFVAGSLCMAVATAGCRDPFALFGGMAALCTGVVFIAWFPLCAYLHAKRRMPA